jgi:hypothetical protein
MFCFFSVVPHPNYCFTDCLTKLEGRVIQRLKCLRCTTWQAENSNIMNLLAPAAQMYSNEMHNHQEQ